MTDTETLREGRPYPHVFFRPDHVLSFGATLVFGIGCASYLLLNGTVWFAMVIILSFVGSVAFCLLYDRSLRLKLRYRLNREGLTIYDEKCQGIVGFIAAAQLADASLSWHGSSASIDLPLESPRLGLIASWRDAIPTLETGARLELVRNPRRVLANLHSVANLTADTVIDVTYQPIRDEVRNFSASRAFEPNVGSGRFACDTIESDKFGVPPQL